MAYNTFWRMSVHCVILNKDNHIFMMKENYLFHEWGLPGGTFEMGETVHEALIRECLEETGCEILPREITGVYHNTTDEAQMIIFRGEFVDENPQIQLSEEHTDFGYLPLEKVPEKWKYMVKDAIEFNGIPQSHKFTEIKPQKNEKSKS